MERSDLSKTPVQPQLSPCSYSPPLQSYWDGENRGKSCCCRLASLIWQ